MCAQCPARLGDGACRGKGEVCSQVRAFAPPRATVPYVGTNPWAAVCVLPVSGPRTRAMAPAAPLRARPGQGGDQVSPVLDGGWRPASTYCGCSLDGGAQGLGTVTWPSAHSQFRPRGPWHPAQPLPTAVRQDRGQRWAGMQHQATRRRCSPQSCWARVVSVRSRATGGPERSWRRLPCLVGWVARSQIECFLRCP